ncbi:zinc finger protein 384b isoform X2 [Thalassophryne amazonica]|uniref:zinc finger protein 384b isoform X2 n=1 Tax=Thalassophryne amazonica TaxID=390379 RepID=UPI00147211B6|nr:zinc finger protein 384b isoform X2 [Thalassophryne amazonica]
MMEESAFNSSDFWSPVPTVPGQIENAMFLNKVKEHQEKNASFSSSSASHYQTAVVTIPMSGAKSDNGHIGSVAHGHPQHSTQNVTVLPVHSTGIMTAAGLVITTPQGTLVSPTSSESFVSGHPATTMIVSALHSSSTDKKYGEEMSHVVVVPAPSKGGRKKKTAPPTVGPVDCHTLPVGNETVILAQLTPSGQVTSQHHARHPYELSNEQRDLGQKDGTKTYRCRMCAATFFSKSHMQIHSKSHTEAKPHKCPHCAKSFANSSYLAQHIRIHSGAKPYTCSYCQKSFRQLSHLQQHTRNHTESKPHKCPHCIKSFANSSYLAQHIRIHTGVKPYTCTYCDKCFRQLSHLQQHMRIHTGDRPYRCTHPNCEKAFTQLSNLQSHRRQHSKNKPYRCSHCNKGYIDAASLEVHMSKHTVQHARIYSCSLCNRSYTSVRQMSISEDHFYMKQYETHHWHQTPGSYFRPCSHMSTVSPLPILPSSQETYLVKHMEKHNPELLTAPAVTVQQNQSQGQAEAQRRRGHAEDGLTRPGGAGGDQQGQSRGSYLETETIACPFDLQQYKTVSASDIQYKPVSVSNVTSHKDLCLTVSENTIQVEHLSS